MPAPRGAAEASPRAPPAAGHPEVGPGKEHRPPHGTDRNAPAPQSAETRHKPAASAAEPPQNAPQAKCKAPPHQDRRQQRTTQQTVHRTDPRAEKPPGARPPEEQTVAGATTPPSSPRAAQSQSGANNAAPPPDEARAAQPCLTPAQAPNTLPMHLRRPGPPTRAGRSQSTPHPPRSHTRCDQRDQSSSNMPPSGKTHPKTQSAQPAHPHQPPNTNPNGAAPRESRHANPEKERQAEKPPQCDMQLPSPPNRYHKTSIGKKHRPGTGIEAKALTPTIPEQHPAPP
ncbi:basic proline-rich protein-like [Cyprinodon tularosa]|uniref:basic proline-rich protein-like n=1 Tax=Cyprinodon tularosa TaxID=77115 RepID=UPI0018E280DD|nr:basic proline-rich protein-like [Cyprinodon tularosa]